MSPMRPKKSELNSENGREAAVSGIAETASRPKEKTPGSSWSRVPSNATLGSPQASWEL